MKSPYPILAAAVLGTVGLVATVGAARPGLLAVPGIMRVEDFGVYWSAAAANLRGQDPYDPANLLPLQRAIDPGRDAALPTWGPPWALAVVTPLAAADFPVARWAWAALELGMVLGAATAAWRAYAGPPDQLPVAWAAAILFYPTLQTLGLGQMSAVVTLGVAGFSAGRGLAAGAFLGLVLVKPHNLHLVGLLVAVWAADRRDWKVAAGVALTAVVLAVVAVAPNPGVVAQYRDALAGRPPAHMIPPTPGSFLRAAFGPDQFWLAFVPMVLAWAWGLWYYRRHRAGWEWPERLPVLLFASYLSSPYGWVYDQCVFLIPLAQILATGPADRPAATRGVVGFVVVTTAACVAMSLRGWQEYTFAWLAPLYLGGYLLARWRHRCFRSAERSGSGGTAP